MLICQDVTELTTDYLEGSLPLPRRLAMRWHLAFCSFCRRHLLQVRATVALLHRLPVKPMPPEEEEALLRMLIAAAPDASLSQEK